MKKTARIFVTLLTLASTQSFATVIGFGLGEPTGASNPLVSQYTESGYIFNANHMHIMGLPTGCSFGGCVASDTGQYLAAEGGNADFSIRMRSASIPFNLTSVDGAELFLSDSDAILGGFPNATTLEVIGLTYTGVEVRASFILDGIKDGIGGVNDFQKFYLPSDFRGLIEVIFEGNGFAAIALDNINVSAVPEPSTWALFLLGMSSLWYFRRRSIKA